ncbi:MAG TPA: tetratricopeptide repeat protein [Polyangiaceae bacterium]|nr:tetratricopeptide repeat protein [Polyangiaceae bacterium]
MPEQPKTNVAEATGRTAAIVVEGPGNPFVVDWKAEQRADLEVAMRQGVAVVAYDGSHLRLLNDCRIEGSYGFFGVVTKEDVVQLNSADEISANLPLGGVGLAAQLGAELDRGASLDVAMVIVGMSRTTWQGPTRADLKGMCDGATHFVRGATVGAFALAMGQRSKTRSAVEIFGLGARAGSESSSIVKNRDGALDACKAAEPRNENPPSQCGALIRIELNPIAKSAVASNVATEAKPVAAEAVACAEGFVWSEGKCARKETAKAFACGPDDPQTCLSQCENGNVDSCAALGYMLLTGEGGLEQNPQAAFEIASKSCEYGSSMGCHNRALQLDYGLGVQQDRAASLAGFNLACNGGVGEACFAVGYRYFSGDAVPVDKALAASFFARGCNAGELSSCVNLGVQYAGGDGVPADQLKARDFNQRACDGGVPMACSNIGLRYEFGMNVPKDPRKARELFERSCALEPSTCIRVGIAEQAGFAGPANQQAAKAHYQKACSGAPDQNFGALSCSILQVFYGDQSAKPNLALVDSIAQFMVPQCQQGVARACGFIAVAHLGLGRRAEAARELKHACDIGDYWTCWIAKNYKP